MDIGANNSGNWALSEPIGVRGTECENLVCMNETTRRNIPQKKLIFIVTTIRTSNQVDDCTNKLASECSHMKC
jgi:hypothetical protein